MPRKAKRRAATRWEFEQLTARKFVDGKVVVIELEFESEGVAHVSARHIRLPDLIAALHVHHED